jgi:hypothetical protein
MRTNAVFSNRHTMLAMFIVMIGLVLPRSASHRLRPQPVPVRDAGRPRR